MQRKKQMKELQPRSDRLMSPGRWEMKKMRNELLQGNINSSGSSNLCDSGGGSRNRGSIGAVDSSSSSNARLSGGLVVGAIPGDVAGLGALVANLASRAQGTAVRSSAVARNVTLSITLVLDSQKPQSSSTYELAAGVALHGLSLAVTGKVVGATALVASGSTRVAAISTTEAAVECPARCTGTPGSTSGRSRAVTLVTSQSVMFGSPKCRDKSLDTYSKVARLTAVIATTVRAVEAQRGTIRLNVA
ncbi:hypothetical protein BDW69DRAFT_162183 [Aspergillus filifer]